MPKVSVIIPVYNVEKYLGECLDSVLGQTLRDIEVICVDDGSTDGSPAILSVYAAKDARVKILTQSNSGAGPARNAGLDAATGEYLFFCDPDDWCGRGMLKAMHRRAKSLDCDVVVSGMIRHDGAAPVPAYAYPQRRLVSTPQPFAGRDAADFLFTAARANPVNKLARRAFVVGNGIRFQNLRRVNDLAFSYLALAKAERIAVLDDAFYHYRMGRPGSIQDLGPKDGKPLCWIEAFRAAKDGLSDDGSLDAFAVGLLRSLLGTGLRDVMKLSRAMDAEALYAEIRKEASEFAALCGDRVSRLDAAERTLLEIVEGEESALTAILFLAKRAKASGAGRIDRAFLALRRVLRRMAHGLGIGKRRTEKTA